MFCKNCTHFSTYLGGTCLGWTDMCETNEDANVGSCSRFCFNNGRTPEYTPNIKEEYSEYDRDFDGFKEAWK